MAQKENIDGSKTLEYSRTANSIYSDLAGKKKSLLELKKTELSNRKTRYKKFFNKKNELFNKINKLKENVALNKSN